MLASPCTSVYMKRVCVCVVCVQAHARAQAGRWYWLSCSCSLLCSFWMGSLTEPGVLLVSSKSQPSPSVPQTALELQGNVQAPGCPGNFWTLDIWRWVLMFTQQDSHPLSHRSRFVLLLSFSVRIAMRVSACMHTLWGVCGGWRQL